MGFQYHSADPVLTGTHGHRNLWWMYNLICCCRLYLRWRWVGTKTLPPPERSIVCENLCLGTSYWTRNVTLYSLCCAVGHIRTSISMFFLESVQAEMECRPRQDPPWKAIVGVSKSTPQIEGLLSTSCSYLQDLDAFSWHTIHKVSQAIRCICMVTHNCFFNLICLINLHSNLNVICFQMQMYWTLAVTPLQ